MPESAYIPTVLVQRKDGTRIYMSSTEYHSSTAVGSFSENYRPSLTRPEVCRTYKGVPVRRTDALKYKPHCDHFRLEEI